AAPAFPTTATAYSSDNFTVTAYDPYANVATGYTGTVHFTSGDTLSLHDALPTFDAGDAGSHPFTATLNTSGLQTITAADNATSTITGTDLRITIQAAAAHLLAVAGFPTTGTAGVAQNFTVTAYDAYGNVATGYTG